MAQKPTSAAFLADNTEAAQKALFQSWLEFCGQLPGGSAAVDKTIAAGALVTVADTNTFIIDTESAATTDNLDTVSLTNHPDGSEIKIYAKNAARTVTVRHNISATGGITTLLAKSTVLKYGQFMSLKRYGNMWFEFGGGVVEKASSAEALAGTDDAKYVTPLGVASVIAASGGLDSSVVSFTASGSYIATSNSALVLICGGGSAGSNSSWTPGGAGGASSAFGITAYGGPASTDKFEYFSSASLSKVIMASIASLGKKGRSRLEIAAGYGAGEAGTGRGMSGGGAYYQNNPQADRGYEAGCVLAVVSLVKGSSYSIVIGAGGAPVSTSPSPGYAGGAGSPGIVNIFPI